MTALELRYCVAAVRVDRAGSAENLRLGALQARACAMGIDEEALVVALDSDTPKDMLMAMILQRATPPPDPREQVLHNELSQLRLGALQRRAAAAGALLVSKECRPAGG